nr:hypothetical protein Iba_chr07fCG4030 [Ipomoea batatas]
MINSGSTDRENPSRDLIGGICTRASICYAAGNEHALLHRTKSSDCQVFQIVRHNNSASVAGMVLTSHHPSHCCGEVKTKGTCTRSSTGAHCVRSMISEGKDCYVRTC